MHVSVGPELGAHVVEVIAGGQPPPVVEQFAVAFFFQRALELVELVQRVRLHGVA